MKEAMLLVLDSNVFDKLIEWDIKTDLFKSMNIEVYTALVSHNELCSTVDEKNKNNLIQKKDDVSQSEIGYFGWDDENTLGWDAGVWARVEDIEFINIGSIKNFNDRHIISLAKTHGAIFVSCDKKALKAANKNGTFLFDCNDVSSKEEFQKKLAEKIEEIRQNNEIAIVNGDKLN
ncbi:MAG: hypothetical protein Q8R86_04360 [Sulfuricurvum sp.]|nr:hypothetical protein [Sulfuricurvum sp.]